MFGDERAFQRYLRMELGTIHAGLVSQRRLLADLLREAEPKAQAKEGEHRFEPRELQAMAARLAAEMRYALRLPMHVYVDTESGDAVYVMDPPSIEALRALGYALGRPDERGRAWFGRARGLAMVRDWPTCVQLVYL
ncbi:MAG: DUF61 family protein [Halobacteriales archaeon]|nr:DUF61 family protein [Halobacteriales archaeon]